MVARIFYTLLFLLLLPLSLLLIFKPEHWQNYYSKLYFSQSKSGQGSFWETLTRALLSMASTETSFIAHRALGILLGVLALYILFEKMGIFALPSFGR